MLNHIFDNNVKRLFYAWNSFWYTPTSTKPLALFRISFGLLLIQYAILLIPDFFVWFGKDGIILSQTINDWQPSVRFNILNLFPESNLWLVTVFSAFIVAAICLTIGFLTRLSSIIVFLCLASFDARNYLIINSGDNFMRLLSFWLVFSSAGLSFSVDHWLKNKRTAKQDSDGIKGLDSQTAPWAQRLMQINMTLVYAQTFTKKIAGITWQNGTAVYFSSRMTDMHRFSIDYLFNNLWTCKLLTWTTLGVELSLFTLIWIKPFRYYVILLGILFHLLIDWTMNIPQFEWVMICSYILFIEPADLDKLMRLSNSPYVQKLVKKFQLN